MYCLGYASSEQKMHQMRDCKERKEAENPSHIDNMVKICGIKPLEKIKTYLDERTFLGYDGKVNDCFYEIYENKKFQEKIGAIVEKYCKD